MKSRGEDTKASTPVLYPLTSATRLPWDSSDPGGGLLMLHLRLFARSAFLLFFFFQLTPCML